jgi:uncharacterized membrane protein
MNTVYLKTAGTLFLVDLFWLSTAGIFARAMIERIQGEPVSFRILSAALVYLIAAYMLLQTTSYQQAFIYGLMMYAFYEATNYSIFERYDWKFAIADSLWGGCLFVITRYLLKRVF